MELDRRSSEQLGALSLLLGEADLSTTVLDLARSALVTVPSLLALQVTIGGARSPVTVATSASVAGKAVVRSSLRLEIDAAGENGGRHQLVYLAECAHAFFEFGNLSPERDDSALRLVRDRSERLVVDEDVPAGERAGFAPSEVDAVVVDAGEGSIQRAIGALMSVGFSAEAARAELQVQATGPDWTAADEARHFLRSLRGTSSGEE